MAETLRFNDVSGSAQVAIVTGAARGLGRTWALALAARGVRVVVNDNDPDRALVDGVVQEIAARGGVALADYHSVVDGNKVVQHALNHFKRVDILINVRTCFGDGGGGFNVFYVRIVMYGVCCMSMNRTRRSRAMRHSAR